MYLNPTQISPSLPYLLEAALERVELRVRQDGLALDVGRHGVEEQRLVAVQVRDLFRPDGGVSGWMDGLSALGRIKDEKFPTPPKSSKGAWAGVRGRVGKKGGHQRGKM